MRFFVVLFLLAALLSTALACDPEYDITFVNKSDTDLCWYESDAHVGDDSWCGHVGASQTKIYFGGVCNGTDRKLILLTVGLAGDDVYRRDSTCTELGASVITITGTTGALVIDDGLGSPTPN